MRKLIVPVILLCLFALLVIFSRRIETVLSFPGIFIDTDKLKLRFEAKFEDINIDDGDGNNINGLRMQGKGEKTIFYFHGNGEPLPLCYEKLNFFNNLGYNVISLDYPGYGKSTGFPYEENVYDFVDKFYKHVKEKKKLKDKDVIVWAYSIGTAVGIDFVLKNPNIDKMIIMAGLNSRYAMGKFYLGFAVQKILFLKDSFNSLEKIKNIKQKTLFVHGDKDNIIPIEQGKKLFKNLKGEGYFLELDNEDHNFNIYNEKLKSIFKKFLKGEKLNFKNKMAKINLKN